MGRLLTLALLLSCSALAGVSQPSSSNDGPLISLFLPPGFPSETVQVEYFLSGSFGGYGSFVQPEHDRQTVDFRAAVNGKPADLIQVIAYLPGCQIVVLDFHPAGSAMWRQLDCKPVGTITLHGRIAKGYLGKEAEVRAYYLADWAYKFFGIADGMGTTFRLSATIPNESGEFSIAVPDFYPQNLGPSHYVLNVHCTNCVSPAGIGVVGQTYREISISSSYPSSIDFADSPNLP